MGSLIVALLFPLHEMLVTQPSFIKFAVDQATRQGERIADHLSSDLLSKKNAIYDAELPQSFDIEARRAFFNFRLWKIKFFSHQGIVIYSLPSEGIGTVNQEKYFWEQVAKGTTYAKFVKKEGQTAERETAMANVVEVYVPVMLGTFFAGAFEIYVDITREIAELDRLSRLTVVASWILAALLVVASVTAMIFATKEWDSRESATRAVQETKQLKSLGILAAGLAHEINNTLLPIIGLTEMVIKNLPEQSRDRTRLEKSLEASRKAKGLVEQVRLYSRDWEAVSEAVDLYAQVREAVDAVRPTLPDAVEVVERLDRDSGAVKIQEKGIGIIISNLVANAVDAFRGDTGRLEIGLSRAKPDAMSGEEFADLKPGDYARLSVRDNGAGMDEETRGRASHPFFTTREVGKGVGLGLFIVDGIVTRCGGRLSISSAPDKGTVVTIYLPVAKDA